ncbi:hypothetical protein CKCBHOJB_00997 [Thauera sp. GDN1]|uniref:hydrolase 2, exosortase A system-associated n=1 Tax=Thauera sp. GDN1 TaxID=2944810 RepID=UPI0024792BCD|nr:hydrolase 2, exosortase A system-associated [Thauera sp. GDN1]WEN41445.1 hypothetical protein CKCBHOJB_00997 [Thauera sp. GDN1]
MGATGLRREAFFMSAPGGDRFCLLTIPSGAPCGALLFVPPFAEELNKSRRMVGLAARAFAGQGWAVLQMDLLGCGDSAGDFGDASWQAWVDDVGRGYAWLQARFGLAPALWSLRAGSLLVSDWLGASGIKAPWLAWQPVINGKQHLTQFLRLKAANEMLAESDARAAMAELRAAIERGETVEVAGYALGAGLVSGLEQATLRLPPGRAAAAAMFEIASGEATAVSPALASLVAAWQHEGISVSAIPVPGSAFWQTQEIEVVPALIEQSLAALEQMP